MEPGDSLVLVVDDDPSVREALHNLIRSAGLACQAFESAADLLAWARPDAPACVVVDVQLRGGSGLDLPAAMSEAGADTPVVFITGHGTIPMGVRAMKDGAVEFLTKPFRDDDLLDAISQALARDREARASRSELKALQERFARLTPREREVFARVAAGRMNKEIAADLGIIEQTIKQHRGRVMQKLGVRSLADLVRFAERLAAS
jgi:FixJ family two-component response regulator